MAFAAAMGRTSPAEGTFPPGMLFFIGLRADKTAGARASVQLFFFTAHATIIDSMQRYVEEALCEIEDGPPGAAGLLAWTAPAAGAPPGASGLGVS